VTALLALVVAALLSLFVVSSLQAKSTGWAVLLSIWLLIPYVALVVILETRAPRVTEIANVTTALLVVAGGLLFLVKTVFVDPDPQGGIGVLFTPVYQGIALIVLLPLTRWLFGRNARAQGSDTVLKGDQ